MLVIGIGLTNSKNRSKAKKPFKNKALAGYMLVRRGNAVLTVKNTVKANL